MGGVAEWPGGLLGGGIRNIVTRAYLPRDCEGGSVTSNVTKVNRGVTFSGGETTDYRTRTTGLLEIGQDRLSKCGVRPPSSDFGATSRRGKQCGIGKARREGAIFLPLIALNRLEQA